MSTRYETKPTERDETLICDICGGIVTGDDGMEHPTNHDYDLDFHKECWNNARSWVAECPTYLFVQDGSDGPVYGEAVEAVLNNKYLLFIEGEESRVVICADKAAMDEVASELSCDDCVEAVVVNGRFYEAHTRTVVLFDED